MGIQPSPVSIQQELVHSINQTNVNQIARKDNATQTKTQDNAVVNTQRGIPSKFTQAMLHLTNSAVDQIGHTSQLDKLMSTTLVKILEEPTFTLHLLTDVSMMLSSRKRFNFDNFFILN